MQIHLNATIHGPIWQPGFDDCFLPLQADVTNERARVVPHGSTKDALNLILSEGSGDFQHATFCADSFLEYTINRNGRQVTRYVALVDCPCLAGLVDPDSLPEYME